jgi:hypothetical protein
MPETGFLFCNQISFDYFYKRKKKKKNSLNLLGINECNIFLVLKEFRKQLSFKKKIKENIF